MLANVKYKKFKQILEENRSDLLERLDKKRSLVDNQGDDIINPDKTDLARISRNKNKEKLLLEQTEHQLENIDLALKRIEAGNYGICSNCGKNIQSARLEIMPTAALCIQCQQLHDH